MPETFIDRWDRTEELLGDRDGNRWKRRLDSIARLLENASTCAAIAIIEGGSFLIATNKEFPLDTETKDQGYLLIDKVMSFFLKVVNGDSTEEEFLGTFKEICYGAAAGLQTPIPIRKTLDDAFFRRVLNTNNTQDFRGLRDWLSEQVEYGHYPKDTGAVFVVCSALLQDFKKVIQFIENKKDSQDTNPGTQAFIKAIRAYGKENIVTRATLNGKVSDSKDMHAEIRILSLMENKLREESNYENYIGISKLCCLDCHAMIYAVNNSSYKNTINTRGAHNVKHSLHWNAPFNIIGNVSDSGPRLDCVHKGRGQNRKDDDFTLKIVENFNVAYKQATQTIIVTAAGDGKKEKREITMGASDVSEYPNNSQTSGSNPSTPDPTNDSESIIDLMLEKQVPVVLEALNQFENKQKIFFTLSYLLGLDPFLKIRENKGSHIDNSAFTESTLRALKKIILLHEEEFLQIMKNPKLVGENAANFFKKEDQTIDDEDHKTDVENNSIYVINDSNQSTENIKNGLILKNESSSSNGNSIWNIVLKKDSQEIDFIKITLSRSDGVTLDKINFDSNWLINDTQENTKIMLNLYHCMRDMNATSGQEVLQYLERSISLDVRKSSTQDTKTDELNNLRKPLSNKNKDLISEMLPTEFSDGIALDGGDCFFDSCAQSLNQQTNGKHSAKSLRETCDQYVKELPQQTNWIKSSIGSVKSMKGSDDYQQYCMKIQFTQQEMDEMHFENGQGMFDGLSIWGDPAIEGKIICEKFGIKLHVMELKDDGLFLGHQLVTNEDAKIVDGEGLYTDDSVMHLACYKGHFVPILKKVSDTKKRNRSNTDEENFGRKISKTHESPSLLPLFHLTSESQSKADLEQGYLTINKKLN